MPQQYTQTATNPKTGEKVGWNGTAWVPIPKAQTSSGPPFTGPNAINDAIAWVRSHPQDAAKGVEQSKKLEREMAPPIVAGIATIPFGGEGVWPILARIAAAGVSAGATDIAAGGTKKEAAVTAAEQGGLQGVGEGASGLLAKLGKRIVSRAPRVVMEGEEFPAIRGQAKSTATVFGKVSRGLGESFVGGPVETKLAQQDAFFKTAISKAAESQGGVRAVDPANFIENTYANAKALLNKSSEQYTAIRDALPNELTPQQIERQALESASVFKGRGGTSPSDLKEIFRHASPKDVDAIISNLKRSGFSDEEIYGENPELGKLENGEIVTAREKFSALQKLRSQTSQAASQAYKRGLSGGSMADYGELIHEVDALDKEIVSTLSQSDPKLAKQFIAAKELHAKARTLENFGMMLDGLTTGLSKAEAQAKGIPISEVHPQSVNYGRLIEKLREFDSRSHFDSPSVLQKLFGKSGADSVLRSANLINNASKSNVGIVAHYLTTYGPAIGAGTELLRGRPEEAAMSAAAYPVMWSIAKLLSYPSFAEPFGKFLQASAKSKEASLWAIRAAQAGRKILSTSDGSSQ